MGIVSAKKSRAEQRIDESAVPLKNKAQRAYAGPVAHTCRRLDRLLHWFHMHPDLTPVEHLDELHRLIAESELRPVLLFKHSYTCGVSMEALEELVAHMNERDSCSGAERCAPQYAMVTVQTHRAVSNAVAQRLGVRHETP